MPVPVYSERFFSSRATSGLHDYTNASGDLFIIRTFTAYYGGDTSDSLFLIDEADVAYLAFFAAGAISAGVPFFKVETDLHLCWPPGKTWHVNSSNAWDYSAHGYNLSLP